MSGSSELSVDLPADVDLHARPAATLAQVALGFESDVSIGLDGRWVDAKSALLLMTLGARGGSAVTLRADGADAAAAVAKLGASIAALG